MARPRDRFLQVVLVERVVEERVGVVAPEPVAGVRPRAAKLRLAGVGDDLVDEAVLERLVGGEPAVAVGVLLDAFVRDETVPENDSVSPG